MTERPTETAEYHFRMAHRMYTKAVVNAGAKPDNPDIEIMLGHASMAEGLGNLSVGLRATYILLDQVRALLQRQALGR